MKFYPKFLDELLTRFNNNGYVEGYKEFENPKSMDEAMSNMDNLLDSLKYRYTENEHYSLIEYCFILALEEGFEEVAYEIWDSGAIKDIENYVGHFGFNEVFKNKFLKHPRIIAYSYGTTAFGLLNDNNWFGKLSKKRLREILEEYPDLALSIPNNNIFDWKKDKSIRL
jgi:hypothetical protein